MIIALDTSYTGIDRIHTVGISYLNKHNDISKKLIKDDSPDKGKRGISKHLFSKFKNLFLNKNERVLIFTWGGPERLAIVHHLKINNIFNVQVTDLEKIVDKIFPCSSLKNVSMLLGTQNKKDRCPCSDAGAIMEIYLQLQNLTESVSYCLDYFRLHHYIRQKSLSLNELVRILKKNQLQNLSKHIQDTYTNFFKTEDKDGWYTSYRLSVCQKYIENIVKVQHINSELHKVATHKIKTGTLLSRVESIRRYSNSQLANPNNLSDGDVLTLATKEGSKQVFAYYSMYSSKHRDSFLIN